MNEEELGQRQPLLPRVSMVWFFICAAVVALALGLIRAADQGQALAAGLIAVSVFLLSGLAISAMTFLVAFILGATEKAVAGEVRRSGSPFADGQLPDQILQPSPDAKD